MEDHTFTAQWEKDKEPAGDDEKPAVADKETEAGSKVRTGDEANAGLWVTLALITALVLAVLAIKRRRQL